MTILDIILLSIGLAMDSFVSSISISIKNKLNKKEIILIPLSFGIFQGIMPIIGYLVCQVFSFKITIITKFISFFILSIISINMLTNKNKLDINLSILSIILISIATSLDALLVGFTLSLIKSNIIRDTLFIGIITFILCLFGIYLGNKIYKYIKNKSSIISSLILFIIAIKILLS